MGAKKINAGTLIEKLEELPTLPTIVYELSRAINDPMASTSDIEKIMAHDQSLTAKVLRLVNSSYYAIPGGVTSLSRAIAYIGFDTVNQLVLSTSILKVLESKSLQIYDINEFWKHATGVGIAAETIAKFVNHPTPSDLFTCGLVHDMGKVALFTIEPDLFLETVHLALQEGGTYLEAEMALGLPLHTEVGHRLAQKWKLPPSIAATIAYHHTQDPLERKDLPSDLHRNVDIVLVANLLTQALRFGHSGHNHMRSVPHEVLSRLAIDPQHDLNILLADIRTRLNKANEFLGVLGGRA